MLDTMRRELAAAKNEGLEPESWFLSAQAHFELAEDGRRPITLFGLPIRVIDTWAWGWNLAVVDAAGGVRPFDPSPAVPADNVTPIR